MSSQANNSYEFGPFRLNLAEHRLLRAGRAVPLAPKVYETLLVLVENSGRTLAKDELMRLVWPDTFVEESSLTQNVFQLRKALGEADAGEQYIETIPKRGYRFAASVREVEADAAAGDHLVKYDADRTFIVEAEEDGQSGLTSAHGEQAEIASERRIMTGDPQRVRSYLRIALAVGLFVLAAALVAGLYFRRYYGGEKAQESNGARTIAVLPFKSFNAESGDEQWRLGMADALISRLSKLRKVTVRPTGAILKYDGAHQDARIAGRELQVDAVLEGTIQREGDRIRVSVQLVRVSDGVTTWSEKFDGRFTNILTMQDSISEQVARRLIGTLSDEARSQLAKHQTENTDAYQEYVWGRYFWNKRTEEGYEKGIERFQRAIELDRGYALAYAGLADCYQLLAEIQDHDAPSGENFERARAAASRALELDETLAEAHATLGMIFSDQDGDWPRAEKAYLRAIELNPDYATARHWYAIDLLAVERFDEALEQMRKANALDPLSLSINLALGQIYFYTHRYDDAIKQLQQTLELDANHITSRLYLGKAFEQKGLHNKALVEFTKILERDEDNAGALSARAHTYAVMGMQAKARRALGELEKRRKLRPLIMYEIAVVHVALGDSAQAFKRLEKVSGNPSKNLLIRLKFDPRLDNLRSDPRFRNALIPGRFRTGIS